MRPTRLMLGGGAAAALALGGTACGEPTQPVAKPGIGLPVQVSAPAATHYRVDCHMRTQRNAGGGISNHYGIDNTGPYADVIPSSNAQCALTLVAGAGPVTLTVTKNGQAKTATAAKPGDTAYLQVW